MDNFPIKLTTLSPRGYWLGRYRECPDKKYTRTDFDTFRYKRIMEEIGIVTIMKLDSDTLKRSIYFKTEEDHLLYRMRYT